LPPFDARVLKIRKANTPEPLHREIYATLRIPAEVMKLVKTWYLETAFLEVPFPLPLSL
jgi:hypothetical protein